MDENYNKGIENKGAEIAFDGDKKDPKPEIAPTEEPKKEESGAEIEKKSTEEISPDEIPEEIDLDSTEESKTEEKSAEGADPLPSADTYSEKPVNTATPAANIYIPPQKNKRDYTIAYAVTMTVAFFLTFAMLCGVLLFGFIGLMTMTDDLSTNEIAYAYRESVVSIVSTGEKGSSLGSGFVLTSDGYIITNQHVVEDADTITVYLSNGKNYDAEYIGGDEPNDVAVVKIEAEGLDTVAIGDSDLLLTGERVVAIGTPSQLDYAGTVTEGAVSFANRKLRTYGNNGIILEELRVIQFDAIVNHGNSGGPLINSSGEVVGIVSMRDEDKGVYAISFALPINGVMNLVKDIIEHGKVLEGTEGNVKEGAALGMTGRDVKVGKDYIMISDSLYEVFIADGKRCVYNENGLKVEIDGSIYENYPVYTPELDGIYVYFAEEKFDAGKKLKTGDVITAIDSKSVTGVAEVREIILTKYAGDVITLDVYRDGKTIKVDITLGSAADMQ